MLSGSFTQASAEESLHLYEQQIKAGLLYNFLKYTIWPEPAAEAMQVCIFGHDPLEKYLKPMQQRSVNQRPIKIRSVATAEETENCSLLFIGYSAEQDWPKLRDTLKGKSILTVGNFPGFARKGGMIAFSRRESRIAAELNNASLANGHLRVEDRLLRLVTVTDGKGE